jgi:hypothetical protein
MGVNPVGPPKLAPFYWRMSARRKHGRPTTLSWPNDGSGVGPRPAMRENEAPRVQAGAMPAPSMAVQSGTKAKS